MDGHFLLLAGPLRLYTAGAPTQNGRPSGEEAGTGDTALSVGQAMASPAVLDIDALAAPISGDNPAGADLRADPSPTSVYYAIKDARNTARAAERQILMGDEGASPPEWKPVLRYGQEALAQKSKDLEVVAYVIEALVRLEGFPGLRDGFRLARELVERYWDGLYPTPDEEGMATRVAPLTGLNGEDAEGTLIAPIQRVMLTEGSDPGPYAYQHYQQGAAIAQLPDEAARQRKVSEGGISLDLFRRAISATPASFFVNVVEDLEQCQDEFAKLGAALDEKSGHSAPPASNIRGALAACLDTLKSEARDRLAGAAPSADGEAGAEGDGEAAAGGAGPARAVGALRTREDAFRTLLQVAEFFRSNEPHTPVSYALEQAVRWGRMSLPELLTELISDESARDQLFKQVGIRPPEPPP
jgi:type VI secretion system protein ImpA